MQSRRNKDPTILPDHKMKLSDCGTELDHAHNPYDMPGRDFDGRSLSPRNVEGSRRLLGVDGRNSSLERRGFGRGFDGGRGERVRSRSPPFGLMRERRGYDDEVYPRRDFPNAELRQRYEFVDRSDLDVDVNTRLKHDRGHEARLRREEDFGGTSRLAGRKLLASEEKFKLPYDLGTTSRYAEGGGGFSSSLANTYTGQFKDERARYPDPLVDKVPVMESYREREKPMFYSRDVKYPDVPMSQSTDHMGLSSGISRAYFQGLYRDDLPLVTDSRKSAKFTEPFGISSYVQRSGLESGRDRPLENEDFPRYWQDKLSLTRAERQDYLNPRTREGDSDIYGPKSDNLYRRMGTHERLDYDHEDWSRPVTRDPVQDGLDDSEYTSRLEKDRIFLDHPSIQKQKVPDYLDVGASKGQEYFDYRSAHVEYGRVSREREMPHLGVSKDHKISHLRSNFGFGRDVGSTSHGERTRNLPKFEYDESYEIEAEGHEIYDSSDWARKRKYNPDAEMSGHNSRGIILDKRYSNNREQYIDDRNEEWSGQDSSTKFFSRRGGYDNKRYTREEREFFAEDHPGFSESEEWLPSDDCMEHVQAYSVKPHKSGTKHSKVHLRHGQQSSHISSRLDRRHVLSKRRSVWIRGQDDNQLDKHENEFHQSDNWMSSSKPEPHEKSEELKQSVQKAFLIFSKKLNENSGVRKRYKEQGRAGSLFCIVCGRRSVFSL